MLEEDSIGGEAKLEQLNILWIIQGEWQNATLLLLCINLLK